MNRIQPRLPTRHSCCAGASPSDPAPDEPELYAPDEQLNAIEAIADAYLGQLGVDDVLREVTRRLVDAFEVDTAAVLLIDGEGDHLVARAACGIEEEVRQGVRIPFGEGFAGHIAANRQPIILDRVDSSTVANPILWEKGIEALLGVPLMDGGTVVGVLHVGSLTPRAFSADEVQLLQQVAARVAEAVRERGSEAERVAAQTLQRSLLPSRLPRIEGLQFAARYVPAEVGGVGGDWYDAFQLPNGDLWVMVGDVGGHGLLPAVIMGRLRAALRCYALEGHGPEKVLALANRKLQFFEPGSMATVLAAVLAPPYDQIRLASAGHLPPVLALPGEPGTLIDVPVTVPLGVVDDLPARSAQIAFDHGATMLACTDGLVERRGESLDEGLGRLTDSVRAEHPQIVCRDVMDALVGLDVPTDDIAVIAWRRTGNGA